jgi:hypothetical protein
MPLIVLLLTLGGAASTHRVSAFSYDDRARMLQYTEAGKPQTLAGIGPAVLSGSLLTIRTDLIFRDTGK